MAHCGGAPNSFQASCLNAVIEITFGYKCGLIDTRETAVKIKY